MNIRVLAVGACIVVASAAHAASGVNVTAEIHQTASRQVVAVDLLALQTGGRAPEKLVRSVTQTKSEDFDFVVQFEDVPPGRYVVTVRGTEPWQRAGERIDVFDWDAAVHVQVAPFGMRLRAVSDGQPLRNAQIVLRHHEAFWEAVVQADDEGEAAVELWQRGPLSATVKPGGRIPFRVRRTLQENVDTEWVLAMPKREVIGTVVDAGTGAPVPKASVAIDMRSANDQLAVSVLAAEDGTFRFTPVFAGEHTLQAAARDYPVTKVAYTFGEEQETHQVTIALERQPKTALAVVDARGRAVVNADVHVFHAGRAVAFTRTSRDGTAAVFVPQKEEHDVWIVPQDGSLGVTRIASGAPHVRVAIADGSSRIIVRTESEAEQPIAGIMVGVRWNGLLIPDEVMQVLVGRGWRIVSQQDGRIVLQQIPAGTYDLLVAGAKSLRVVAVPGETSAVMTFTAPR